MLWAKRSSIVVVVILAGCSVFQRKDGKAGDAVIDEFFAQAKGTAEAGTNLVGVFRAVQYGVYRYAHDPATALIDGIADPARLNKAMARDAALLQGQDEAAAKAEYEQAVKAAVATGGKGDGISIRAVPSGVELLSNVVLVGLGDAQKGSFRGLYEGLWNNPDGARGFVALMATSEGALAQLQGSTPALIQQATSLIERVPKLIAYVPSAVKANPMLMAQSGSIVRQATAAGQGLTSMIASLTALPGLVVTTGQMVGSLGQGLSYVAILADPTSSLEQRRIGIPAYDTFFDKVSGLPVELDHIRSELALHRLFVAELVGDPSAFVARRLWEDTNLAALVHAAPAVPALALTAVPAGSTTTAVQTLDALLREREGLPPTESTAFKAAFKGLPKPDATAVKEAFSGRAKSVAALASRMETVAAALAGLPSEAQALASAAPGAVAQNPLLLARLPALMMQMERQGTTIVSLGASVGSLSTDLASVAKRIAVVKL